VSVSRIRGARGRNASTNMNTPHAAMKAKGITVMLTHSVFDC
jgi:hypothetical protein